MLSKFDSFTTLLLLLISWKFAVANHIRTGDVTQYGEFDSYEGVREYYATAHIIRPVLCWEDLEADGIAVESCNAKQIRFRGNIDPSDFAEGVVITFPKEDYAALGCPPVPETDDLSRVDQVVFREIIKSISKEDDIVVKTKNISGGNVVPTVELHVGGLIAADRQQSSAGAGEVVLEPVSRTNNIGATLAKQKGSKVIFKGAKVNWQFSVTAGVCEFMFDRSQLLVTWEQSLSATCSATFDFQKKLKKSRSGTIFRTAIPRAGFSIKIFLVGTIRFGLFGGVGYDAEIEVGGRATAKFHARIKAGQKVSVGIRKFSIDNLSSNGRKGKRPVSFKFKKPVARANAFADGFVGVRPFVEAVLELPLVGDAKLNAGGTVGINADVRVDTVPFKPVRKGRRIGVCKKCHAVQGTIDLEGRRLSVSGKVPGLEEQEKIIRDKFLDLRIGILCLFKSKCPSGL